MSSQMKYQSRSAKQSVKPVSNVTQGHAATRVAARAAGRVELYNDTYIAIKDLKVGKYRQTFLVQKITNNESMVTANGSHFARIVLKDLTGEIEGVVWNYVPLHEGQYYQMSVDLKVYKGELEFQADASNILTVDAPLNIHDYIKGVSDATLTSYAGIVEDAFEMMTDDHYKNVIGNAIHRLDLINALKTSPYGLSGPLAYRGGLLVHVAGSLRLAKVMAEQAKESETPINISLVMASCIVRNIGWHTTTAFINGYLRPKDAFYMTGINRASARYVDHLMIHVESDLEIQVPESKRQALENSCNDMAEIKTIEGRIAATADDMINLLHFGGEALQRKTRGNWTEEFFTGHNNDQ